MSRISYSANKNHGKEELMIYPEYIARIIARLEEANEEAYVVGGSVRDALLGIAPHDFDIATSALPQRTAELFSDCRVIETGIKHGTVTVIVDGEPVEITTFRVDGEYSDSRHPDTITFTSRIEEDLSRRDFTVNAMAYSSVRGLVDAFGGKADLEKKIIRAVREPSLRFSEDALRIMRAFRFSAQLGFEIEENTLLAASALKDGLLHIAKERIASEFIKLLISPCPQKALSLMSEHGVLEYIIGDIKPCEVATRSLSLMQKDEIARMGMFFAGTEQERIRRALRDLKCSNRQVTGTLAVARGAEMCVHDAQSATSLIAETGEYAPFAVRASVLLGISSENAEDLVSQNKAPSKISELKISGRDLIALGAQGKEIGAVLDVLLREAMLDPDKNEAETLKKMAKGILNELRA